MKQRTYGYHAHATRSSHQASGLGVLFWFIVILFILVCIGVVHLAGGTANFLYDVNHLGLFVHQLLTTSGLSK
jgi:hypothetical protein